jgi:HD-like signal output (HDOD) protein
MTFPAPPVSAPELVNELQELISLPDIYLRLQEVMASQQASMDKVAEVITLDPALVARLLKIANSALYNLSSPVETVSRAINILGTRQVHDLVLAASVARSFQDLDNELLDMKTYWYRCVQCGILARSLAEAAGMRNGESLFIRGLLLDLGHLVLYSHYPDQCRAALADARDEYLALPSAERRHIGCDARELTTDLMTSWGLPESFINASAYLTEPEYAPDQQREIAILHIASRITQGLDMDLLLDQILEDISPKVWKLADLPPESARHILDATAVELIETMYKVLAIGGGN